MRMGESVLFICVCQLAVGDGDGGQRSSGEPVQCQLCGLVQQCPKSSSSTRRPALPVDSATTTNTETSPLPPFSFGLLVSSLPPDAFATAVSFYCVSFSPSCSPFSFFFSVRLRRRPRELNKKERRDSQQLSVLSLGSGAPQQQQQKRKKWRAKDPEDGLTQNARLDCEQKRIGEKETDALRGTEYTAPN